MVLRWAENIDEAIAWVKSSGTTLANEANAGLEMLKARETAILEAAKHG